MSIVTLLIIVLLVMLIAGSPLVISHPYGWGPSSAVGIILIILVVLLLLGRI